MSLKALWAPVASETMGLKEFIRLVNRRLKGFKAGDGPRLCLIHIDGGGFAITTGIKLDIPFPNFGVVIKGWTLVADVSGSIVIDLWKDTYGNYPPTVADTITASAKPTLSAVIKNQATSVPTWNATINQGETLRVNVDSITTCTRVTLALPIEVV